MISTSKSKRKSGALSRQYQQALRKHLTQGTGASQRLAHELGRQAVAMGLETLDLALIHEQALIAQDLPDRSVSERKRIIFGAAAFFAEAILPMEETHRSKLKTDIQLSRLNQALNRRTLELAASNRELIKEINQRKEMEQNLRQSEQNSGRLLTQSKRMQEQMHHLSRRILSVQEEERKRISRELHDVIAQILTGINVSLSVLKKDVAGNTKGLANNITRTQKLVEKSVDIVHRFARELRPAALDDLGLIPALHSFLKKFAVLQAFAWDFPVTFRKLGA
jgi:signal transduction histidine kinase